MALKLFPTSRLFLAICGSRGHSTVLAFTAPFRNIKVAHAANIFSYRVTGTGQTLFYTTNSSDQHEEDDENVNESRKPIEGAYNPVDVDTSIRYMSSDAYNETYGDDPVWYHYRPNHKGNRPKARTRKTCVRKGSIATGNPCPICRDDHLVIHYKNIALLKQFLSPNELTIHMPLRTQICMKQYKNLLIAVEKAKECGLLEDKQLETRMYDYSQYYSSVPGKLRERELKQPSIIDRILEHKSQ